MSELIALCGIDGTGKSTQAALLHARLTDLGHSTRVLWCRWNPFLARPAIRLLDRFSRDAPDGRSRSGSRTVDGTKRRRELRRRLLSSRIGRTLWTGLMVLDYGLQVAPRLTMALRSAEIVIVDRYRHDVIIDLSAGGDLAIAPRALRWLLPEPDLIIVLDVAEEIALGRKPDTPDLTYLEQRRALYRRLAEGMPTAVLIDATDPPDVVSEGIFQAMIANSTSLRA
jgi:thymidylate kinase